MGMRLQDLELTSADLFRSAVREGRVVVEFYTQWCPDCRRVEGSLTRLAGRFAERFTLLRVDAEAVEEIAAQYDVRGIPSFLAFTDGELVDRLYSRDAKSVRQVEDYLEGLYADSAS